MARMQETRGQAPRRPRAPDGHAASPPKDRQVLEREIDELRQELGVIVHEVERRLRQATSVQTQVRRHPAATVGGLVVVTAGVALIIGYRVRQRRQRTRLSRLTNLRLALAHLMEHPEDVVAQRGHPVRDRLLGAGKAVGVMGAKRAARRMLSA